MSEHVKPTCADCTCAVERDDRIGKRLECHRHAPSPLITSVLGMMQRAQAVWPEVEPTYWCAEHSRLKEA